MKKRKIIGVYRITCKENKKVYYGSSKDIKSRFVDHKICLRNKDKKCNPFLLADYEKYGENSLQFEIIMECETKGKALYFEAAFIQVAESYKRENGYNIQKGFVDFGLENGWIERGKTNGEFIHIGG